LVSLPHKMLALRSLLVDAPPQGQPGHDNATIMDCTTKRWFILDPTHHKSLCSGLVEAFDRGAPFSFVGQCKNRQQHLFFDLDCDNPDPGLSEMGHDEICQAVWWALEQLLGKTQVDRHRKSFRIVLVSGCRPGKFSYHVHLPFLSMSKQMRGDIYDRVIALPNSFPDTPHAHFLASVVDPAVKGGGLYLPFTAKPNLPGSVKRPIGIFAQNKPMKALDPMEAVSLCVTDFPRDGQLVVDRLLPPKARVPPPPPMEVDPPEDPLAGEDDPHKLLFTQVLNTSRNFEGWIDKYLEVKSHLQLLEKFIRATFAIVKGKVYYQNSHASGNISH